MFYTYIIQTIRSPKRKYIGFTTNLKQRLIHHNTGLCSHTTKFRPWEIKFYAAFKVKQHALNFERFLKSGSGHAFVKQHLFRDEKTTTS